MLNFCLFYVLGFLVTFKLFFFSFYSFSSGFLSDKILKFFVYKYINNGLYKL